MKKIRSKQIFAITEKGAVILKEIFFARYHIGTLHIEHKDKSDKNRMLIAGTN